MEELLGRVTLHEEGMRGVAGMQRALGADDIIPEIFPLPC